LPATRPAAEDLSSLSIDQLMNVEINSVTKHSERIADAPSAVTVITQEDIQRSGLDSIPELLRLVPGMDVARLNANTWAISARGFNDPLANKLQVLFDGRTVYSPNFAGVYWDAQDYVLQDLDRIEVIRGPGATLWGANAVNGVVNITSKSADQTQGLLADGWAGSDNQNTSLRYGGMLDDRTYYRVYGKFSNTDNFKNADGSDAHDGWDSAHGGFRIDRFSTDQDTLTLEGDAFSQDAAQTNRVPVFTSPFVALTPTQMDSNGIDFLARWTHVTDAKSEFALQLYYDCYNRDEYVLDADIDTFDLDFHDRFPLGQRQEITWGGGARLILINDKSTPTITVDPAVQRNYLINQFVQDDIALVPDRLHAFIGTKLEENNYTGFEVQPSARLLWTPDQRNSVWGAVSRAVRTPSVADRYTTFVESRTIVPPGTPAEIDLVANPGVSSEEMMAYELGYRVQVSDALSFDVDAYYDHYDKLRDFLQGTPQFVATPTPHLMIPLTELNSAAGPIYGASIAANWKVTDGWRLMGSYTLQQSHIHSSLGQTTEVMVNGSLPVNQFQIHSYLNITKNLQFNSSLYYVDRLTNGNIPAYVRLDMAVSWQPCDGLDLSAGVQNILDNQHPEFPSNDGFIQGSEVPRSYYGQITWRF